MRRRSLVGEVATHGSGVSDDGGVTAPTAAAASANAGGPVAYPSACGEYVMAVAGGAASPAASAGADRPAASPTGAGGPAASAGDGSAAPPVGTSGPAVCVGAAALTSAGTGGRCAMVAAGGKPEEKSSLQRSMRLQKNQRRKSKWV